MSLDIRPATLVIRPATLAEAPLVHSIMAAAFAEYGAVEIPVGALAETVADVRAAMQQGGAALALRDGRPVGSVRFTVQTDHLFFARLATLPELRGAGIGRAMVAWLESHARSLGLREVQLDLRMSLLQNWRFYKALGYETTAVGPYPGGADIRAIMAKRLAPPAGGLSGGSAAEGEAAAGEVGPGQDLRALLESVAAVKEAVACADDDGVQAGSTHVAEASWRLLRSLNPSAAIPGDRPSGDRVSEFTVAPAGFAEDLQYCLGLTTAARPLHKLAWHALRLAAGTAELIAGYAGEMNLGEDLRRALADGSVARDLGQVTGWHRM